MASPLVFSAIQGMQPQAPQPPEPPGLRELLPFILSGLSQGAASVPGSAGAGQTLAAMGAGAMGGRQHGLSLLQQQQQAEQEQAVQQAMALARIQDLYSQTRQREFGMEQKEESQERLRKLRQEAGESLGAILEDYPEEVRNSPQVRSARVLLGMANTQDDLSKGLEMVARAAEQANTTLRDQSAAAEIAPQYGLPANAPLSMLQSGIRSGMAAQAQEAARGNRSQDPYERIEQLQGARESIEDKVNRYVDNEMRRLDQAQDLYTKRRQEQEQFGAGAPGQPGLTVNGVEVGDPRLRDELRRQAIESLSPADRQALESINREIRAVTPGDRRQRATEQTLGPMDDQRQAVPTGATKMRATKDSPRSRARVTQGNDPTGGLDDTQSDVQELLESVPEEQMPAFLQATGYQSLDQLEQAINRAAHSGNEAQVVARLRQVIEQLQSRSSGMLGAIGSQ